MNLVILAALAASVSLPSVSVQAQVPAKVALDSVPACSKTVTSNCKKRRANGVWFIVGGLAVAAGVAVAAGGKGKSVSP
jgi:hypothetical protein